MTHRDFYFENEKTNHMMEDLNKKEFQNSLDLTNDELEKFVPELLNGLWELGSMPEYIIELIQRNGLGNMRNILDLGCGKGAVLIKIAEHFDVNGIGIDIVPNFIEEAKKYAVEHGVSEKLTFKTKDILDVLKTPSNQDIVIYGYDSEILGDLGNTLIQLNSCIKADGHIVLEFMFAEELTEDMLTEDEMLKVIEQSGFHILDRIDWERDALRQINRQNTAIIRKNVDGLISNYPEKKSIFSEYLQNQIDECEELENDYICCTLLLQQNPIEVN